uniref:TSPc domain-containing protein n=1 Tax=Syphacia muris TaxID=451379 RepID=A0A0N5AG47_9BILA
MKNISRYQLKLQKRALFRALENEQPTTTSTASPNDVLIKLIRDSLSLPKSSESGQNSKVSSKIDTGGSSFNRLVLISEEPGVFGTPILKKFNRRGLDWSDGDLKLVNIDGNGFFGSNLTTHDKSANIPVKSWLNVANVLLNTYNQLIPNRYK